MPKFSCAICRDDLRTSSRSAFTALFCGHVFHETCIQKWFAVTGSRPEEGQRIRSCPTCRRPTHHNEGGLKLYFEASDDSDDEDSETLAVLKAKFDTMMREIKSKQEKNVALSNQIDNFRRQNEQLRNQLSSQAVEAEKFRHALKMQDAEFKKVVERGRQQSAIISSVVKERDVLQYKFGALQKECFKFASIKHFLESNTEDIPDDHNLVDAQTLKAVLSVYKKNFLKATKSEETVRDALRALVSRLKKYQLEIISLKEQLSLKSQIIKAMKRQYKGETITSENDIIVIDNDSSDSDDVIIEENPPQAQPTKTTSKVKEAEITNQKKNNDDDGDITVERCFYKNKRTYRVNFPASLLDEDFDSLGDDEIFALTQSIFESATGSLGGHSSQDQSARLKPCRMTTNHSAAKRRK